MPGDSILEILSEEPLNGLNPLGSIRSKKWPRKNSQTFIDSPVEIISSATRPLSIQNCLRQSEFKRLLICFSLRIMVS